MCVCVCVCVCDRERDKLKLQGGFFFFIKYDYHYCFSGEKAFKSLSVAFGWAKNPMISRIASIDKTLPITFIYGSETWMQKECGHRAKSLRIDSYVDVNVRILIIYTPKCLSYLSLIGGGGRVRAMVLGKLPVAGRPTSIIVGQGPTAVAVGAGGVVWTFFLSSFISLFFLPLSGRRPDID